MKRQTALLALAAVTVMVSLSHLQLDQLDDGWLLRIDGRPVDVAGYLDEALERLIRDCRSVRTIAPDDPLSAGALEAIEFYSPPDSHSASLAGLWAQGDWMLASARFTSLQPALILLRRQAQAWQVVQGGVWSASTYPFHTGPFIRRFLARKVPQAPAELLACHQGWPGA